MKKILFITPFQISNKTAGQNYTKNLIKDLSKDYLIDIINFKPKENSNIDFNENVNYIKSVRTNNFFKLLNVLKFPLLHPFFTSRFSYNVLFYLLKNQEKYDFFYFDFSQTFIYSLFIHSDNKFLMAHDIILQKYKRKNSGLFNISKVIINLSEKLIFKFGKSNILCFSNKDKNLLEDYYKVNSEAIDFYIEDKIKNIDLNKINLNNQICLYGAWNRIENLDGLIWFEKNVMSYLENIKILIIGGGLTGEAKKRLSKYKNVEVLGFVDNPYKIISNCKALIAPLFEGAGVKVKVIEALACGTPVIGTDVAFEGIEFDYKDSLKKVNKPKEYINAIKKIKKINISDKVELKKNFNLNYPKNKFKDIIDNY